MADKMAHSTIVKLGQFRGLVDSDLAGSFLTESAH